MTDANSYLSNMTLDTKALLQRTRKQDFPLSLSTGKMGICLSLYILGKKLNNKTYQSDAFDLLNDILENIDRIASLDIKHGITGIGIGLNYLLSNKYIEGDINYILKDMDNLILKNLNPKNDIEFDVNIILDMLHYMAVRLSNTALKKDEQFLFRETSIEYINKLSFRLDGSFFEECIPFSIESKIAQLLYILNLYFKLDFYNNRLSSIIHEISYKLFSLLPILHSNKLLLLGAMSHIKQYIETTDWQHHIDILKNDFNVDTVIRQELRQKNISVSNGAAGIFLALELSKNEFSKHEYEAIRNKLLHHFNSAELEQKISEPNESTGSFLYGELGALTIYAMSEL